MDASIIRLTHGIAQAGEQKIEFARPVSSLGVLVAFIKVVGGRLGRSDAAGGCILITDLERHEHIVKSYTFVKSSRERR